MIHKTLKTSVLALTLISSNINADFHVKSSFTVNGKQIPGVPGTVTLTDMTRSYSQSFSLGSSGIYRGSNNKIQAQFSLEYPYIGKKIIPCTIHGVSLKEVIFHTDNRITTLKIHLNITGVPGLTAHSRGPGTIGHSSCTFTSVPAGMVHFGAAK